MQEAALLCLATVCSQSAGVAGLPGLSAAVRVLLLADFVVVVVAAAAAAAVVVVVAVVVTVENIIYDFTLHYSLFKS